jgi:D-beta-D-heptose 7-phosphate kinase/D-beta-D-heptose 1-phosphate adenosyltransferase
MMDLMLPELHKVLGLLEGGFAELKVLVVGDLMLDRYILGEVDRISPEAPVPVLRHAQRYSRAGGAANVAMNLAGLGCKASLAGFWGDDAERRELQAQLDRAHVDSSAVITTALPTISKTRIIGRQQQLLRLDIESREHPSAADMQRLIVNAENLAATVHAVVLSDYAKGALSTELCERVIRAARRANVPVLVDPKTTDFSKYSGATTVCPNLQELSAATGLPAHEADALLRAAEELRVEHDFRFLTVTMSEKGIRVVAEGESFHSPARAREVFDVSGAGDTVIATLAAGLAGGLAVRSAVELANLAASIVVGKVGTVPIAQHELVAALTPSSGAAAQEKVLSRERLLARVAEWRAAGETIVFTNGCFDLLHVGHIALLEECHRFGSKLVLGLNTDASVARVKGASRPLVGQEDRVRVMAALSAVDAVTLFEEDTPEALLEAVRPDVLVKGGDAAEVVGRAVVEAYGGRVETVPLVAGISTANLLQKLDA